MNILMFASNPVAGGVARVFIDLVTSMRAILRTEDRVFACIDKNNPVQTYDKIEELERLEIFSQIEICGPYQQGSFLEKVVDRSKRYIEFAPVKKKNIQTIREYIRRNKIDCVVIHNGSYVGDDLCDQVLTAAYLENVPQRMVVLHSDFEKAAIDRIRFWGYDKKLSHEATDLLTVSNFTKNRITNFSYLSKDIHVIYNGISENCSVPQEEKDRLMPVSKDKTNILMIGNFSENKGHIPFIEAVKILKEQNKNVHVSMIGNVYEQDHFDNCCAKIAEYGLENVISIYHGIHNAAEFVTQFDMLVVPSLRDESFGLISVEAMASGRAVVAFACGGIPEVVADGVTGLLVPVGDYRSMAEKLALLIDDRDACKKIGEQGRQEYIRRFSVDAMAKRYYDYIMERRSK